jgi:hypothetical protein
MDEADLLERYGERRENSDPAVVEELSGEG